MRTALTRGSLAYASRLLATLRRTAREGLARAATSAGIAAAENAGGLRENTVSQAWRIPDSSCSTPRSRNGSHGSRGQVKLPKVPTAVARIRADGSSSAARSAAGGSAGRSSRHLPSVFRASRRTFSSRSPGVAAKAATTAERSIAFAEPDVPAIRLQPRSSRRSGRSARDLSGLGPAQRSRRGARRRRVRSGSHGSRSRPGPRPLRHGPRPPGSASAAISEGGVARPRLGHTL